MMDQIIRDEARLRILQALAQEVDERLTSSSIEKALKELYWIARGRAFIHAEMDYLAELGAVRVILAGDVRIAELTERGKRHLERTLLLEGAQRPDRQGA